MEFLYLILQNLVPIEIATLIVLFLYFLKIIKEIASNFISLAEKQSEYLQQRIDVLDRTTAIFERTISHQEKDLKRVYEKNAELEERIAEERNERLAKADEQLEDFIHTLEDIEGRTLSPSEIASMTEEVSKAKASAEIIYQLAIQKVTQAKADVNYSFLETLSTYAHDFRTPLVIIQGYIDMLPTAGKISKKQSEYIVTINKSIQRLVTLVDDILDIGTTLAGLKP